jgi:hypothetical protein
LQILGGGRVWLAREVGVFADFVDLPEMPTGVVRGDREDRCAMGFVTNSFVFKNLVAFVPVLKIVLCFQ